MQLIEIGPAALSARLGAGKGFNADRAGAVKRPCRGQDCPEAVFSFVLNKRLLRPPPSLPSSLSVAKDMPRAWETMSVFFVPERGEMTQHESSVSMVTRSRC